MCMRIYIRFIPVYIIISNSKEFFKKCDLIILIICNLIPLPVLALKFHQDDFAGIFGISSVQVFFLFILMVYVWLLTLSFNKKISSRNIIFYTIIIFLFFGIGEIKIAFILTPIIVAIITLFNRKDITFIINIVKLTLIMMCMTFIANSILVTVYPGFKDFFKVDMLKENIYNYTMKTNNSEFSLGRLENIVYTNKYILNNKYEKLFGLGIGSSMPSENWYFERLGDRIGKEVYTPYETEMYKRYGYTFGYQFSSMNIIYLENGVVGIIIFYVLIVITIYRSIKLIRKSNDIFDRIIGNVGFAFMLAWIPLTYYYAYIIERNPMYMCILISALVTNRYNELYRRRFLQGEKR